MLLMDLPGELNNGLWQKKVMDINVPSICRAPNQLLVNVLEVQGECVAVSYEVTICRSPSSTVPHKEYQLNKLVHSLTGQGIQTLSYLIP